MGVHGMRKPRRFVIPGTKRLRDGTVFSKNIRTMNDLFVHQLQDIYYAEQQLVKALPKMAEKATASGWKQGFLIHLDETRTHVQRLERVFQMHGAGKWGRLPGDRRNYRGSQRGRGRGRGQRKMCWMRR